MASITLPARVLPSSPLRPLNILHDLPQVADLIELCFESTLDDDGQSYLHQMRQASRDRAFLSWAGSIMEGTSMPLTGYVWEEEGKIVGNTSLIFQTHRGRKLGMIANVATHPNYRRRGIGRALTERAMTGARQRGATEVWLQVRHDNPTAIRLYKDLGFTERTRRTTYQSNGGARPTGGEDALSTYGSRGARKVAITRPSSRHWPKQHEWLERAHPDELGWYARWDWQRLGPGLGNSLHRLFAQFDVRQWAATGTEGLLAAVSWVPTPRASSALWLAAPSEAESAVSLVLEAARRELAHYRRLTVEYPAGELAQEIEAAGFEPFRTLLWMRATGFNVPRIVQQKEI